MHQALPDGSGKLEVGVVLDVTKQAPREHQNPNCPESQADPGQREATAAGKRRDQKIDPGNCAEDIKTSGEGIE
jgi:hypothetical protein